MWDYHDIVCFIMFRGAMAPHLSRHISCCPHVGSQNILVFIACIPGEGLAKRLKRAAGPDTHGAIPTDMLDTAESMWPLPSIMTS